MKKFFVCLFVFLFAHGSAYAIKAEDFAEYFEIDIDEQIPSLKELREQYNFEDSNYDRRYTAKRYIGNVFDSLFRKTITLYGTSEARIVSRTEEELMEVLERLPKEYYPYIGPYLHVAYGIPEKIKNMPGIKETKNKFPTRIAPQLADMENIEFLSPFLYILLIPELWPSNLRENEYIKMPKDNIHVHVQLPSNFMEKVRKVVPEEEFYPDNKKEEKTKLSELRTIRPDKNSPLTGGDIKAFAKTISKVNEFTKQGDNYLTLISAGTYLDLYEEDKGKALLLNTMKDLVNPCQRLVQKIKISGMETEFAKILAKDGFDIKGWAYTCDKAVKAYRKSRISTLTMQNLIDYKRRVYDGYMHDVLNIKQLETQFSLIQGAIEMHKSPQNDWLEMMNHYKDLRQEFEKANYMLGTEPLSF